QNVRGNQRVVVDSACFNAKWREQGRCSFQIVNGLFRKSVRQQLAKLCDRQIPTALKFLKVNEGRLACFCRKGNPLRTVLATLALLLAGAGLRGIGQGHADRLSLPELFDERLQFTAAGNDRVVPFAGDERLSSIRKLVREVRK